VDTKNAPAISLGISHSLRSEPDAGAWVRPRPARSSIAADRINHGRVMCRVDARARAEALLEYRQRRELGVRALGIALRAGDFARDRRRVLCAHYDEAGTTNGLDCFCRDSGNRIHY
jgi:hypothetical protein